MTDETFIAEVLDDNRITIPRLIAEQLKVRKGNKVRIVIRRVR
jgi:bifunctional DNA-binding transcriptional regulator/antitoxin component of YhaV-PrlF toxin-antitoxin module